MCGIFGVIAKGSRQPIDYAQFRQLGAVNIERGNRAFGGLLIGETEQIFRFAHPYAPELIPLEAAQPHIALGHIRAPTGGQSEDVAEVHPFETRDLLLAHNGLLLNHEQFPQWRVIDPALHVDSQVIVGGIQCALDAGESVTQAIKSTVEKLDGQQACWLWHKPTQMIYVWRVMSPIYVSADESLPFITFSSVRDATQPQTLLEEGHIYQLDAGHAQAAFQSMETFRFYNPYRIRIR